MGCKDTLMFMPHEASDSITLANTTIRLKQGQSSPSRVVLKFSPSPRIHFELLESSQEFQLGLLEAFLGGGPTEIELDTGQKVEVINTGDSLIPKRQRVVGYDAGKPMHAITFGIINFPDFIKPRSQESLPNTDLQQILDEIRTIHLITDSWQAEVKPVHDHKELQKRLGAMGGFAITHRAIVTRIDGDPFEQKDVWRILRILSNFLSFARGVFCGITLVRGLGKDGSKVWEVWGVTKVRAWEGHRSCLNFHNGASLEALFSGFWRYFRGLPKNSVVRSALEWYLESNAQEAAHTSIVLNQAALERLATNMIGAKPDGEHRGDWINRALLKIKTDTRIPEFFQEGLGSKNFRHGPHALVSIRNDLLHSKTINEFPYPTMQIQARKLGLWFIELLLLHQFGHSGMYFNRITGEWIGEEEPVPWAKPD